MGDAKKVDRLEIRWPNGQQESFEGLAANQLRNNRAGPGNAAQPTIREGDPPRFRFPKGALLKPRLR